MITPQDKARAEAEKQGRYEFRCQRDCEDNPIDMTMGAFCESRAQAFADGAMWSCGHPSDIVDRVMEVVDTWLWASVPDNQHMRHPVGSKYRTDQPAQDKLRARLTKLFKPQP